MDFPIFICIFYYASQWVILQEFGSFFGQFLGAQKSEKGYEMVLKGPKMVLDTFFCILALLFFISQFSEKRTTYFGQNYQNFHSLFLSKI